MFSAHQDSLGPRYLPLQAELASLLRTAAEVMRRRHVVFTETHAALYRTLFEQTAAERRHALRDAELRALRRSA